MPIKICRQSIPNPKNIKESTVSLRVAWVILIPEYRSMPKLNCFASLFTLFGLFLGFSADGSERPNILWITSEDNNVNWVGCYGNPHAQTPYIDKLASEGFQYMNCFANAPVCAPSRSGWITGVHPVSLGTLPMRSRYSIPHDQVKYYPDYLRRGGVLLLKCTKDRLQHRRAV